jgi:hypothetical protein
MKLILQVSLVVTLAIAWVQPLLQISPHLQCFQGCWIGLLYVLTLLQGSLLWMPPDKNCNPAFHNQNDQQMETAFQFQLI